MVWTAKDSDGDKEIFFYNGKKTIQLTNNDIDDDHPQISGDNLVWIGGNDGLRREIFWYDGNEIIQLTNNAKLADVSPQADWNPKINNNKIIWERNNFIDGTASVMSATIDDTESSAIISSNCHYKTITSSTIVIAIAIFLVWLEKLLFKH